MPDDSHPVQQEKIETAMGRHSKNARKIEWKSYAELPFEKPSWLIKGLIPAKSLVMLYGARGQGKTFVALDIAASVASGLACLGCEVEDSGRVGYLLAERPEGLKRRLAGWLHHRQADPRKLDNIFVAGSGTIKIDNLTHRDSLIRSIRAQLAVPGAGEEEASLKLLIIDPLAAHMDGSENEATAMTKFTDSILELSEMFKCSVLLVHHEGKNNFNNRFGARGSSALEAALDTVLYMLPDQSRPNHSEIRMTKQREFEETPSIWVEFNGITGTVPGENMEPIALGKQPSLASPPEKFTNAQQKEKIDQEICDEILAFIKERASSQSSSAGVTVKEIQKRIADWVHRDPESGRKTPSISIVREHVDDLAESNRVVHLNPGKKPHRYGPAR